MRDGYMVQWLPLSRRVPPGQEIPDISYLRSKNYIYNVRSTLFDFSIRPDIIIANNAQSYEASAILSKESGIPAIGIVRDTQMLCESGTCMDNTFAMSARACEGYLGSGFCNIQFHRVRGQMGLKPWPAWFLKGMAMHHRRISLRNAAQQFVHLVTISDSLNSQLRKAIPKYPEKQITTIRNLPTAAESLNKKEIETFLSCRGLVPGNYFLFAGRKTYGKGADLAVQSVKIARDRGLTCQLLMVGRGKILNEQISGVVDEPSVSQSMLMSLLENALALLIPGRWQEGLHRTMVDALRMGVPIICSVAGAPPLEGVKHNVNGLIVSCNDTQALTEAMIDISGWDKVRRDMSKKQATAIFHERFSENVVMMQWKTLLDMVASSSGSRYGIT